MTLRHCEKEVIKMQKAIMAILSTIVICWNEFRNRDSHRNGGNKKDEREEN